MLLLLRGVGQEKGHFVPRGSTDSFFYDIGYLFFLYGLHNGSNISDKKGLKIIAYCRRVENTDLTRNQQQTESTDPTHMTGTEGCI